jgi:hypothetical protein
MFTVTLGALGGHAQSAGRIKYYDDLLEENTERVMQGLPPTEGYRRLDDLIGKCMLESDTSQNDGVAIATDVMDFLGAFERLLGSILPQVN